MQRKLGSFLELTVTSSVLLQVAPVLAVEMLEKCPPVRDAQISRFALRLYHNLQIQVGSVLQTSVVTMRLYTCCELSLVRLLFVHSYSRDQQKTAVSAAQDPNYVRERRCREEHLHCSAGSWPCSGWLQTGIVDLLDKQLCLSSHCTFKVAMDTCWYLFQF